MLAGIVLGAMAFIGSLGLAYRAQGQLGLSASDGTLISSMAGCDAGQCDASNRLALQLRALETYAHVKAISNNQALGVLVIGAGMGLMSIGFSLFLVGAEGAFRVQASGQGKGALAIAGTAPGLLAFAIAGVLVGVGSQKNYDLEFSAEVPTGGSGAPASQPNNEGCAEFWANPTGFDAGTIEYLTKHCPAPPDTDK